MSQTTPTPGSVRSEQALIGCLLIRPELLADVDAVVQPADFYRPDHARLYELLLDLWTGGEAIDEVVVSERVHRSPHPERLGGAAYVLQLAREAPPSLAWRSYAEPIADAARRRRQIRALDRAREGLLGEADPDQVAARLRDELDAERSARATWLEAAWRPASKWLDAAHRPPERAWLLEAGPASPKAGTPVLPRGKTAILAGAGAVGKSTALLDLALVVAGARPHRAPQSWMGGALRVATLPGEHEGDRDVAPDACGGVAILLGEEDAEDAHRRLWWLARQRGLPPDARADVAERLVVVPAAGRRLALLDEDGAASAFLGQLRAVLRRPPRGCDGWALVILDPLSRFAPGDAERDNGIATRFVEVLETLATETIGRPTVLAAHHSSQAGRARQASGASAVRGVTGLTDGVRWVATLTEVDPRELEGGSDGPTDVTADEPPLVRFEVVKSNYAPPIGRVLLQRGDGGLLRRRDSPSRAKPADPLRGLA